MTVTATAPTVTAPRYATTLSARSLRRRGVVAGFVVAAVTTGVAAAARAAGVSFEVDGKLALVALHVLAAAIVVPALVRHTRD